MKKETLQLIPEKYKAPLWTIKSNYMPTIWKTKNKWTDPRHIKPTKIEP